MAKTNKKNKFHGMTIVHDQDQVTVRGKHVIEENSNGEIVCRSYDSNGNAEDNPMVIDVMDYCASNYPKRLSESNITAFIKRTVRKNSLLISESVIETIQRYLH